MDKYPHKLFDQQHKMNHRYMYLSNILKEKYIVNYLYYMTELQLTRKCEPANGKKCGL